MPVLITLVASVLEAAARTTLEVLEAQAPGLLAALPGGAMLAASFGLVFGVQRLVPTYDRAWYKALRKPAWNPPNYVFPLVWIPLKILLSVALYLVMSGAPTRGALLAPLALFGAHLALGNMWNVVFFGRHRMQQSLGWMGAFWASIAASIAAFYQVSPLAASLFAPTLLWVTIAAKLNFDLVRLNRGGGGNGKAE